MKKIINISILLAALAFASSCQDEAGLNPPQPTQVTLSASAADTKTVLDGNAVEWESGDEVALVFTHPSKSSHVASFTTAIQAQASSADFTGTLPVEVIAADGGYNENAFSVYPASAVTSAGSILFTLPSEQTVRADGTFASKLNLTSASVSLADIQDDGNASAAFRNALSVLRIPVKGDVKSVTLTGTAPLAGSVPFEVDFTNDGRLKIDTESWSDAGRETTVTLLPAGGSGCFAEGNVHLLVLPGTHSSMTATVTYKDYGTNSKTSSQSFTFEASKYYTLNLNSDSETLVSEISSRLDNLESSLSDIEAKLEALGVDAQAVRTLIPQIQSVVLMSEYLDNAVYAPYAVMGSSKQKDDIVLDYLVRPASVAQELVEKYPSAISTVMSAKIFAGDLDSDMTTLTVKSAVVNGDVMSVTVDASGLSDSFYDGNSRADLALLISDGNTDLLSDFASLVPKVGSGIAVTKTEGIPVMKGATVAIPFKFAPLDPQSYNVSVSGEGFTTAPRVIQYESSKTGYVYADFPESCTPSSMSVTLSLTSGGSTTNLPLTFAEGGVFSASASGTVDYIGGEVTVDVAQNDFGTYTSQLKGGSWIYQTFSGVEGRYSVDYNSGSERTATVDFSVRTNNVGTNGDLIYTKSVTITQLAINTALQGSYYADGDKLLLNTASAGYTPLNVVILGDGYRQKDLLKGGKFERSARSAYDAFFSVEPFKTFMNRFNVYMVAYESEDEGPRLSTVSSSEHVTYFDSYYKGGSDTYLNCTEKAKITNIVQSHLGLSGDAYYRTIVILLVNTAENIGSTDYPVMTTSSTTGDGYASFSIAMLAANSTGTSGLIRHEAGGHGFGRLGDEYAVSSYTVSKVNERHAVGFYRNIAVDHTYWSAFTSAGYTSDEVMYDAYNNGDIYRSTHEKGIMWNNNGSFNAVSRHAIYERIIKQTQGATYYSWQNFLDYDKNNR